MKTFIEYQHNVRTTAGPLDEAASFVANNCEPKTQEWLMRLALAALGVASEAGELAGCVNKMIRDDVVQPDAEAHILARLEKIKLELGDCYWHLADTCNHLDFWSSEIVGLNWHKLRERQAQNELRGDDDEDGNRTTPQQRWNVPKAVKEALTDEDS